MSGPPAPAGSGSRHPWTLPRAVAAVLRGGMVASLVTMTAGTVLTLAVPSSARSAAAALRRLRRGQPGSPFPHTIGSILGGAARGHGPALVMLGVLLLVATPILRVAVSVAAFARERDRAFSLITTVVLLVLLTSFLVGWAAGT